MSKFTCQGKQKLNDETVREYFTCTNKKDECLKQMLKRRLRRIDKYELENTIQINMLNKNESESSVESDSDYYWINSSFCINSIDAKTKISFKFFKKLISIAFAKQSTRQLVIF